MRAGRKKIRDLNEILKRKEQYDADKFLYDETYGHAAQVLAASMAAAVLYGIHLDNLEHTKEYRKKKMKNAYDSLRRVYDLPQVFGKDVSDADVQKFLKDEYGFDLSNFTIKYESFEDFMERINNGKK